MEFWDVIEKRHSVRDFKSEPIRRERLEKLARAAALAPSAMNSQPYRLYFTSGEQRAELGQLVARATVHLSEYMDVLGPERYEDAIEWYSSLGGAPVLVAVVMESDETGLDDVNKLMSVGAAIENLQLAAVAEGLASCNITFALWVRDDIEEMLGIPEASSLVSIIAVGYPGDTPVAAPAHRFDVVEFLE